MYKIIEISNDDLNYKINEYFEKLNTTGTRHWGDMTQLYLSEKSRRLLESNSNATVEISNRTLQISED